MRREIYRMSRGEAVELLRRSPVIHVASTTEDGALVLRTVHGVVCGDAIAFHGAPAGEKAELVGRPCVISAEEIIAEIPSYFVDPERACPATTYYKSVQVHGVLERVEDATEKAEVLTALMHKFQPEGGYVPIASDHPLYTAAVRGLLIVKVSLEQLDGKGKLGQNRKPDELARVLERLWQRGHEGDVEAIELVRRANPETPVPAFLAAPDGATMCASLRDEDLAGAIELLAGEYWNTGVARETIAETHRRSSAWVGAKDRDGKLIATARALSDGMKRAWIFDVAVDRGWRGRGLGDAVMKLILDHPAVRGAREVRLTTRDADHFYQKLGFERDAPVPERIEMIMRRSSIRG